MTPDECADTALWALKKKIDDKAITDRGEGERYSDSMLEQCQAVMATKASGKFRCVRLATSAAAVDACLEG